MRPTRKTRSVNRRYINEVSPSKDGDSAKRSNSKKRKFPDMLGSRWTKEELSRFYDAYRKYGTDWRKVAGAVRNRSPEMAEALFTMNKAYLSLPHGAASALGLIAMVTDHYCNLAGSDSDQESNDGAGSSRKTQKHARGKVPPSTCKASNDQIVTQSQNVTLKYGDVSLLKKKSSGGIRLRPVGKRTPRFPVSFPYENSDGGRYVSPNRQEASQRGGSPQVSRSPSRRAENVLSSPFMHSQKKDSLAELPNIQIMAADMDGDISEGNTGSDTVELSRYKPSKMESTGVGNMKNKTIKLDRNEYDDRDSHLDATRLECNETEEDHTFGATRGKLDLAVTNGKFSSISSEDEAAAFDALQTLADLSLMMPTENKDDSPNSSDSKLQFIDDNDARVDGLVSDEDLPVNKQKEKSKCLGIRKKGYKPVSSSEVPSFEASKPAKASVTKIPRKNQKMQVSKIPKTAYPDIQRSGTSKVEDGPTKKLMNKKRKKSSEIASLNILSNSGNSSSTDLQKEASDLGQSGEVTLAVNHACLPTKFRRKRKIDPIKPLVQKGMKLSGKISNDLSDPPSAVLHDRVLNLEEILFNCLSNPRLRRWCTYEWFYSAIDYPWFSEREFVDYLHHVGLGHVPKLTRAEWGVVKSSLGKSRRFSEQFLKEEKEKLKHYRDSVRKHYTELRKGVREGLPADLARPLSVGQRVIAIHPKRREIHDGTVLTVDHSSCHVQFDHHELGVECVMDIDCMSLNRSENMPSLLGEKIISVDKSFENLNEMKINGQAQECMKLCYGHTGNNIFDSSQFCPSANPPVSSSNANLKMWIGSAETASDPLTPYPVPSTLALIQAKEADLQALAELTRALDKKEAVVVDLRRMNDVGFGNQEDGHGSVNDSETFKKQYAAVLIQLNEANKQVSSALSCLRQRNRYQGNITVGRSGSDNNIGNRGAGFSLAGASQNCELGSHVNEIIDSSKVEAGAMVDAAMQASDPNAMSASGMQSLIPSELISKCVATLLLIQKCAQRQSPPSEIVQILDSAVRSLQPRSSRNLAVYTDIQHCMGIIRNQIMALIPT